MYVLGISCYYHDSAACLLKDGKIIAAAEEERFTRKKHDNSFPLNAIRFCLDYENIKPNDISYIAFYEKPFQKFDRIISTSILTYPFGFVNFYKALPEWINIKLRLPRTIKKKLKYNNELFFISHHLSHAASTFFLSPYKEAAIVTVDGIGEWDSTGIFYGKENKIKHLKSIKFPHSLGLFYSTVTSFLGFKVNNDEYKVMGLSAYGKPVYYKRLKKIIDIKEDGSFKLDMKYFDYEKRQRMFSKHFIKLFGKPRKPESRITERDKNLAASIQKITEEVMLKISRYALKITKSKNICYAGGVILNSKANGLLLKEFKNVFFMPAAGDDGGAIGAAKYVWHSILGNKEREILEHLYYGPEYSDSEIKDFFDKNKIRYKEVSEKDLPRITAKYIAENKIVGWFQGRMEFGPRALGARSILANATNPEMKDIVNKRVKHREEFRPFAPALLKESANRYLELRGEAPFMIFTTRVLSKKIPAVTHVDGTARPQTVSKESNQRYYKVIKEFGKITKIPVILNTSFNVRGMPIVCSPKDAYECFIGTGIDVLVMNRFIVEKKCNKN